MNITKIFLVDGRVQRNLFKSLKMHHIFFLSIAHEIHMFNKSYKAYKKNTFFSWLELHKEIT